jgi:hypothetical protein
MKRSDYVHILAPQENLAGSPWKRYHFDPKINPSIKFSEE